MLLQRLRDYRVVLGSSLPRRAALLRTNLGIDHFEVVVSNYAEDLPKQGLTVDEYVAATCRNKAEAIVAAGKALDLVLICCDTVIDYDGAVREKPTTRERQREMIAEYQQVGTIRVVSAVTVKVGDKPLVTKVVPTTLRFNQGIDQAWIEGYVESGEGLDAAGGFKYQEKGALLFDAIEGDYFNVVGLPVAATHELIVSQLD